MKPAAERLKVALAQLEVQTPKIPVVNNVDVAVETDPSRIRDALYRQAFGPVRWVECVQKIKSLGVDTVVECGPGKVLAGMTKRIDASLNGVAMYDPTTLAEAKAQLG
jgi:[acyl-carrier-protein] S-malonyltransferase